MSTFWTTPDPRRAPAAAPAFGVPYAVPAQVSPTIGADTFAGLLAAAVTVLLGAPVGLLWAAVAPRPTAVVDDDGQARLAMPGSNAFIAGDGFFLLAVTVAGIIGGLLAWHLGRRHGPAVVVGLTAGGLAAAYVAMVVGQQVTLEQAQQAIRSSQPGLLEVSLRLLATQTLVGWPVGALLGYVATSLVRER
ncbi:MAG: DUF2567 domain-containing protein [Mycobacteriales bacterium]